MNQSKIENFNLKDGTYIRYRVTGNGPPLLLLHTFRNRLEYSDLLVQELIDDYSIYTLDLPGFGDSPINVEANYDQEYFTIAITEFITRLDLSDVTIAGESIGGILPITVSLKIPNRIKKLLSFNPYDYDTKFAEGIRRGNFFANVILFHVGIPLIGSFFSMLENKFILKNILAGGFVDKSKLPSDYLNLLTSTIRKRGYTYHFINVLSNFQTWINCKNIYEAVTHPTVLVYGEADWSTSEERLDSQVKLKLDSYHTIKKCGHFSFLEQPKKVAEIIKQS